MKTHQETKTLPNRLEPGESLVITHNGRSSGRSEPRVAAGQPGWDQIMGEVWRELNTLKVKGHPTP